MDDERGVRWLGGQLAENLVKAGHTVVGASRRQTNVAGVISEKVDLGDQAAVDACFEAHNFELVVHLAGALGWCRLEMGLEVNLNGTRRVLEACAKYGVRKVIVASSVAMIGTAAPAYPPQHLPVTAAHGNVLAPWPYALSKAQVEELCVVFQRSHPETLDIIALRIGNCVEGTPPNVVHRDGIGIVYPVPAARSRDVVEKLAATEAAPDGHHVPPPGIVVFPEAPLCSIAISDMTACLEAAVAAPFKAGFRALHAVGPTAYSEEPVADLFRAWYGDAAAGLPSLAAFEKPGAERAPIYDLEPTFTELGWRPQVDLNAGGGPVRREPVFLVITKKLQRDFPEAVASWCAMARDLAAATRHEAGCDFYDFVRTAPDTVVIVERWASETDLAHHAASTHFRRLVPLMDAISTTATFEKGLDALRPALADAPPMNNKTFETNGSAGAPPTFLVIHKTIARGADLEAWLALAKALATATRQEAGCLFYDFVALPPASPGDATAALVIVEKWATEAALAAHAASAHFKDLVPRMDAISKTPIFEQGPDLLFVAPPAIKEGAAQQQQQQQQGDSSSGRPAAKTTTNLKSRVGKLLVMYDSSTSCTAKMAALVVEGCLQLDRTEVRVRTVGGAENHWDKAGCRAAAEECTFEDVAWADGVAVGTPTNLGGVSWRMKKFWDDFSQAGYWAAVDGKVGCSFSSEGGIGGGGEIVCMAMNAVLLNFGFSVFGVTDYVGFKTTLHYGAVVAKAPRDPLDRACCRRLGVRLAEFVAYYIVHRDEAHPMLASKKRDAVAWGGPIPDRKADPLELERTTGAALNLADSRPKALIFTRMVDYVHDSTPAAAAYIAGLAQRRGYDATVTSDPTALERKGGLDWAVVVLINNSGECFDLEDEALSRHVAAGRGVLGVHAAVASFLDGRDAVGGTPLKAKTALIADVLGAHFVNHPPPQTALIAVDLAAIATAFDGAFRDAACASLPATLDWHDEYFNYDRKPPAGAAVLARVDEATYTGGTMGDDHPMVWCFRTQQAQAPVFYCGIGHFDSHYRDGSLVANFLEAGFNFVAPDPRQL